MNKRKSFLAFMLLGVFSIASSYAATASNYNQQGQYQQQYQPPAYQQQQYQQNQQQQYQQNQQQQVAPQQYSAPSPYIYPGYLPPAPVNPGQDEANDIYKQNQHRGE
ncbi:MAG: hypothetical protein WCF65_03150 [Parachlamydiaceae bacterium]